MSSRASRRSKQILAGLGVGCLFFGGHQWWLRAGASDTPTDISIEKLIADGAPGNRHVRIGPHHALTRNAAHTLDERGLGRVLRDRSDPPWSIAYYPIYSLSADVTSPTPLDGRSAPGEIAHVVIARIDVESQDSLPADGPQPGLTGLISNGRIYVCDEIKAELMRRFRITDFDSVWLVLAPKKPVPKILLVGSLAAGLALISISAIWHRHDVRSAVP